MPQKLVAFYPRLSKTNERIKLTIGLGDFKRYKEAEKGSIIITDVETHRQCSVRKASCGFVCRCDAIVKERVN